MPTKRGSELARRVYVLGADRHDDAVAAIDAELQEVREVLLGLSYQGKCWCLNAEIFGGQPPRHHEYCERTQQLMARLSADGAS